MNLRCVRLGRTLDTKPNTGVIRSTFVVDEKGLPHCRCERSKVKMLGASAKCSTPLPDLRHSYGQPLAMSRYVFCATAKM
jgi:hypothetical protein